MKLLLDVDLALAWGKAITSWVKSTAVVSLSCWKPFVLSETRGCKSPAMKAATNAADPLDDVCDVTMWRYLLASETEKRFMEIQVNDFVNTQLGLEIGFDVGLSLGGCPGGATIDGQVVHVDENTGLVYLRARSRAFVCYSKNLEGPPVLGLRAIIRKQKHWNVIAAELNEHARQISIHPSKQA